MRLVISYKTDVLPIHYRDLFMSLIKQTQFYFSSQDPALFARLYNGILNIKKENNFQYQDYKLKIQRIFMLTPALVESLSSLVIQRI